MGDLKRLYEFWTKDTLVEKPMLAGRHDQKETLQIMRAMCKSMKIPVPKVQFKSSMKKIDNHLMYAHFDWEDNMMYINKSMNKNLDDFLKTILHELYHAKDYKRLGKKFADAYEMEIAQWQAENPGKEDDWYKNNSFEIKAEKFAQQNWKKWKKVYNTIQMRKNPEDDGFK